MNTDKSERIPKHAFSDLFVCAHCGSPIERFMCTEHEENAFWCCKHWCEQAKRFPEEELVTQVHGHLGMLRLPEDRVDAIMKKLTHGQKRKPKASDLCRDFLYLFAHGTAPEQQKILRLLWETSGANRSKLDSEQWRIQPTWRPMWRALLCVRVC